MRDALATERYLNRYIEPNLPDCPVADARWHDVLVIPAYREDPEMLSALRALIPNPGGLLVMLVLNRPDSEPDTQCNRPLGNAVAALQSITDRAPLYSLAPNIDLYLHDMDQHGGALPAHEGVGLARKTGCDIALSWQQSGAIAGDWLHFTDADAVLPKDHFSRLQSAPKDTVAATFPFHHEMSGDRQLDLATALYELRLHHYVLGLEHAGSPYALHTLGSCIAVRTSAYCHARGVPRRAGAEDFYLLNKLAKIGRVLRLDGNCITLASRESGRVPFGTGPAVRTIAREEEPLNTCLFYDPRCFATLRALLQQVPHATDNDWQVGKALRQEAIKTPLADAAENALLDMGLEKALAHCRRQSRLEADFIRHFHQWFDGFRTLKLIHALRDAGLPDMSLDRLENLQPQLWPRDTQEVEALRAAVRQHWRWRA